MPTVIDLNGGMTAAQVGALITAQVPDPLTLAKGGTGSETAEAARYALGLAAYPTVVPYRSITMSAGGWVSYGATTNGFSATNTDWGVELVSGTDTGGIGRMNGPHSNVALHPGFDRGIIPWAIAGTYAMLINLSFAAQHANTTWRVGVGKASSGAAVGAMTAPGICLVKSGTGTLNVEARSGSTTTTTTTTFTPVLGQAFVAIIERTGTGTGTLIILTRPSGTIVIQTFALTGLPTANSANTENRIFVEIQNSGVVNSQVVLSLSDVGGGRAP